MFEGSATCPSLNSLPRNVPAHSLKRLFVKTLDGRNRTIVIAGSLARVIFAIESLAFVGGHISLENTEISPHRYCVVVL